MAAAGLEKVAPYADGNCKYPPGVCAEGCRGPRDRALARVGACVRVSVSGCEHSAGLAVTLAVPAVPGSLLRAPSCNGFLAPRPAPVLCPHREAPLQRVFRRPLPLLSQPAARDRPPLPPTPLPTSTTAESAGESRLGSPRTRGCHRGGGPRLATSGRLFSSRADCTARHLLALLGLGKARAHPKEVFSYGWLR